MKRGLLRLNALLPRGRTADRGRIDGLPLRRDVVVVRDRWGIPHITASDEHDLYLAQGFVQAQDRLWQMEMMCRTTEGRLAEIGGPAFVGLDHFSHLAGFGRVRERAIRGASPESLDGLAAYAEGVNAYLAFAGRRLPLELRALRVPRRTWRPEDLCGVLPLNAWFLQTNYHEEIAALLAREHLDAESFNELFPSNPGARLPNEDFFARYGTKRFGPLSPAALAFYVELAAVGGGSNNWVVAEAEGGKPLLANDPHLAMMVPQIWHLCHLRSPGLNIAGASMVGVPGIVIGRNEQVAWGLTNVMTDIVDLYAFEVNPTDPLRYRVGSRELEMERETLSLAVAGEGNRELTIHRTLHGPLITEPSPGVEAVAALTWYGTLPDEEYRDTTLDAFFALNRARSVAEAMEAGALVSTIGQNLVVGDARGGIAWHATGLVPLRSGYSGRAPADGSSGRCGWQGFLPYDRLPALDNPERGWIATANNRTVEPGAEPQITYAWCAPYRIERIGTLLGEHPRPSVEETRRMQLDRHSAQAEALLPRLLSQRYQDPRALEAAEILRGWDRRMEADSAGPLLFSVFHTEANRLLLEEVLGESLPVVLSFAPLLYTAVDDLLLGGEPRRLLAGSRFADGGIAALCEEGLVRAIGVIEGSLGRRRRRWRWGRLHTYHYEHLGGAGRTGIAGSLLRWLLDRGPYPAGGGPTTVNVAAFNPSLQGGRLAPYRVTTVPSIRFVASLADPDRTFIVAPMGESGQPADRHYDDMIRPWLRGDLLPLPLTPTGVAAVARRRLVLAGRGARGEAASPRSTKETQWRTK